jgi:hypothetical protein
MRTKSLVGVLLSVAIAVPGLAQTTTASVVGNVRDKGGAAIPQAEVTAQNMETSFTRATTSDETGGYLITNLPVGVYRVTAQKQGSITIRRRTSARLGRIRTTSVWTATISHPSTAALVQKFFNTAAFTANQPGVHGTAARNLFSGPGMFNTNLSLVKSFRISERLGAIQFRAEFFNAFNNVNFAQPDSTFVDKTFGQVSAAADPRVIQFALRYQFIREGSCIPEESL